jgi:hypothetical protein
MALAAPSAAAAADSTVGLTGTTLTFQSAPGGNNDVSVARFVPKGELWIADRGLGAKVLPGTGCSDLAPAAPAGVGAKCPAVGISRLVVLVGDGTDFVSLQDNRPPNNLNVAIPSRIFGAAGNDDLEGGDGPDTITGGLGVNKAKGMAGNDRLQMRNGVRDTLIDCGTGILDVALVDKIDPRPIACETVLRPRS